jgi:uncharacterized protein
MAKKKKQRGSSAKAVHPPVKKRGAGPATWIAGAVALLAVVAVIFLASGGGNGASTTDTSGVPTSGATSAGSASPEEQKYIGRLLPAGYTEPSVADAVAYSSALKMSDVTATQGKRQTSIEVSEVVAKKIVFFEYAKAGSDPIPMIAYVKPSGKLFIGVSYCIPCKGTGQRIEADGTLTCESCGTKRDLETGVGLSGACKLYPLDELPVTVKDGSLLLENSAIDQWTPQPLDRPSGA